MSFDNSWEPKRCQQIVIFSHWGLVACSLGVIWWSFGGHSVFFFNFYFGNKFDLPDLS